MRVFISYSSKDRPIVNDFATDVEKAGHEVWFDQELSGGQEWWNQILENICHCDLFLFTLTRDSVNSYACELEYTYALDLDKNIIPILLENVSEDLIPHQLKRFQYVDYTERTVDAVLALSRAFTLLRPARPLPSPLPRPPEVPITYKKIYQIRQRVIDPTPMNLEEQRNIHLDLKEMLADSHRNTDEYTNLYDTLIQLRNRSDLLASVDREIAETLSHVPSPKTESSRGKRKRSSSTDKSSKRKFRIRIPLFGLGTFFSPKRISSRRGFVSRVVILAVLIFILMVASRADAGSALFLSPILAAIIFATGFTLFYLGHKLSNYLTRRSH